MAERARVMGYGEARVTPPAIVIKNLRKVRCARCVATAPRGAKLNSRVLACFFRTSFQ